MSKKRGENREPIADRTERALLPLMVDLAALVEATERVRVQVHALAAQYEIKEAA